MIALFIGRFQPFHTGHLHAIKTILKKFDSVIIGIGSSQISRTTNNPFSFEERKEMITNVLRDENISDKCKISEIPDVHDDKKWLEIVSKLDFDAAVTGNEWTRRCLESKYKISEPDLLEPEKYNATNIRNLIRQNKEWKHLVPKEVYKFVKRKLVSGEVKIIGELETGKDW